jgi:excinuclease ABC subunit A
VKVAGFATSARRARCPSAARATGSASLCTLTPQRQEIARRILREIEERCSSWWMWGWTTSASRAPAPPSGGESQRIRLASQIGSGLTGVLYVLDEPSIGLHQRDNERLLVTLRRLRDLGNSVIVVEHDEDAIRTADWLVDIGPGAGAAGGHVVSQGTPQQVMDDPASLTGAYLSGRRAIPMPDRRRAMDPKRMIRVVGASGNNLKDVSAEFPLGTFTAVAGVSGGGKSTLVVETLFNGLSRRLMGASAVPAPHTRIEGLEHVDKVIDIDQSPIGRTPRSNPATYTGLFAPIRDWFSELPDSRSRGYKAGRFSFNVKGGRCEACQGDGVIKIEMHFLPDVYVTCDTCKGKRYNRETLEVKFRGKSIADVLDMTVTEGRAFFAAVPPIHEKLRMLEEVGLGYIHLGQQATTSRAARRSGSSWRRSCRAAPQGGPCTSSTSRRPACTSRTCASCWKSCMPSWPPATPSSSSSTTWRSSRRPTGCSTSVPREARAAAGSWPRARRSRWPPCRRAIPGASSVRSWNGTAH